MVISRRLTVILSLAVATTLLTAPLAHAQVFRDFWFDWCDWRSVADGTDLGTYAATHTIDRLADNCKRLDADVSYFVRDRDGRLTGPEIKWCPTALVEHHTCIVRGQDVGGWVFHHQSLSKAQSWETDRWQSSGWWG